MEYYKVKAQHEGKQKKSKKDYLILGELYTRKEVLKIGLNESCFQLINVSKKNVYISFGIRKEKRR